MEIPGTLVKTLPFASSRPAVLASRATAPAELRSMLIHFQNRWPALFQASNMPLDAEGVLVAMLASGTVPVRLAALEQ
jgi:hypothetical protein